MILEQEKALRAKLNAIPNGAAAGNLATKFGKVTFPERNEVADLLSKAQDAEAAINVNNRRDKQRLVGIEKAEETAAASASKKAQDERNKALKEQLDYTTEIGKKRISNAFEIEQQLLDAETDGAAKSRKQADLDYRKKISDLEIQKAEFIKKQNELSGGIDKKTGKPSSKFSSVIPEVDQKQFEDLAIAALKQKDAKIAEITKKDLDELLKEYQSFEEKRKVTNEKYKKDRQALIDSKKEKGANIPQIDSAIVQADKYNVEDNAAIDKAIAEKEISFKGFVDRITMMGLEELAKALEDANKSMDLSGATDGEKAVLRAKIASLTEQIKSVKTNGGKDSETDVITNTGLAKSKETVDVLKQVGSEINNVINGFEGMDAETRTALQAASNITMAVVTSISGIISLSLVGSEAIKGVERASVILAIIGAAISVVTIIIGLFTAAAEKRKQEAEAVAEAERSYFLALQANNEELRKKYEWIKKNGELTLDYINRETAELSKQKSENQKEQNELTAKLAAATYTETYKRNPKLFEERYGNNLITDTRESSLVGKSLTEIADLSAKGLLSKGAEELYQALKKAKEEGEDIAKLWDEQLLKWKELSTGTTKESVIDSIIQGFKDGKKSAVDFASTFEELMKGAIQQALKEKLNVKAQSWYDDFYEKSKDGLTEVERAQLKADYDKMINDTAKDKANLEEISGTSMADKKTGVTGELQAQMTEGTGSQLVGLWSMTAMDVRSIKELMYGNKADAAKTIDISATVASIMNDTYKIQQNTLRTANNTDGLIDSLNAVNKELNTANTELREIKNNTKGDSER